MRRRPTPLLNGARSLGALDRVTAQAMRRLPASNPNAAQTVLAHRGLFLLRQPERTAFEASICEPMFCLILQGCKEMSFGERTYRLRAGECAVVSHALPILSRVRQAPYLVVLIHVEVDLLRSLYQEVDEQAHPNAEARALEVHAADAQLLDTVGRYFEVTASPGEARVLGPMLLRELHYRLMVSPLGPMLRRLVHATSHASAISRAVALLRKDFRSPHVVEQLAREVGMSVSSFHKHFKAVMQTSPLQYQKELRLLEAQRLLRTGTASVTSAAFDVGYSSCSQFSREYVRKFGHPPSQERVARA